MAQPKWWIVERTLGGCDRYRRLSKDDERRARRREAWIYVAMTHRMSRLTRPLKDRDDDLLRRPPKRPKP